MGPLWAAVCAKQPAPVWACGLRSMDHRSAWDPAPVGVLNGVQLPSGFILMHGLLPGLHMEICSAVVLHELQGESLLQCLEHSFFIDLPTELFLSRFLTAHSNSCCTTFHLFFLFFLTFS